MSTRSDGLQSGEEEKQHGKQPTGSSEEEEELGMQPTPDPFAGRRRLMVQVSLARPTMHGYLGPAWEPPLCCLVVHVGGVMQGAWRLPSMPLEVAAWRYRFDVPVEYWDWMFACLDLEAVRADCCHVRRVVFRQEQPHTSVHSVVIGRARVPLLDALVLGDDDDDCDGDNVGGGGDTGGAAAAASCGTSVVTGTRGFDRVVHLHRVVHPASGYDTGAVAWEFRGSVHVAMRLVEVLDPY